MSDRVRIDPSKLKKPKPVDQGPPAGFISSGCTLLDCMLGGGWGIGRVVNLVGDKSSGKTLLGIEACANFAKQFSAKDIRYAEGESAFSLDYARSIGLPMQVIPTEPGEITTVQSFYNDLSGFLKGRKGKTPALYLLDSLDSLSDDAEMNREFGDNTYGTNKAKDMSELFRRINAEMAEANCTLFVISQIRDKIGVTFGEKKTRSGGRALDFYCSQVVWLAEIKKLQRQVMNAKRVIGVEVLAKNRKNKLAIPFREAEFTLMFNYGVDDEVSMLNWLHDHKAESELDRGESGLPITVAEMRKELTTAREDRDQEAVQVIREVLKEAVRARWAAIEEELRPPMAKY